MLSVPDSSYEVTSSSLVDGCHDRDLYKTLAKAIWSVDDVEICCQYRQDSFELVCHECGERLACKDIYIVTKHGIHDQKITIVIERWMCRNPRCKASCKSHVLLPESLIPRLWYPAMVLKLCLDQIDPGSLGLGRDEIKDLRTFKRFHAKLLRRWKKKPDSKIVLPKPSEQPPAQPPDQLPSPPPEQSPPRIPFYLCILRKCSRSGNKIAAKTQPPAESINAFAIEIRPSGPGPPCPTTSILCHLRVRAIAVPYNHRETDRCCRARCRGACSCS